MRESRDSFLARYIWSVTILLFCIAPQAVLSQETDVPESSESPTSTERVSAADSTANFRQLLANINFILSSKILKNARVGLSIYSLDKSHLIFERNSHQPLTPASTTKLFFAYAAMKTLGADFAIPTQVVYDGSISSDSVLNGNLYLIGHGDCLLGVSDLEALAERVRRAGIKAIKGDIVADDSFFDALTDRQAYSGDKERMQALPPICALGVNRNLVTVLVSSSGGGVTRVQTIPQSDAFSVSMNSAKGLVKAEAKSPSGEATTKKSTSVKKSAHIESKKNARAKSTKNTHSRSSKHGAPTSKSGARRRRHSELVPQFPSYGDGKFYGDYRIRRAKSRASGGAAKKKILVRVSSVVQRDGHQEFAVTGAPSRSSTQSFTYEIRKPALAAAGILYRSLGAEGIRLEGHIRMGIAGAKTTVVAELKRPLTDLISVVNKNSDNFVAEHIMKIVGGYCCGNQQCSISAFSTLSAILDSAHIPLDGCALFDGSGLSRRNKTSTSTQLYLLRNIADQPFSSVFYNTMSIAGVDGTLHKRMIGTNAQNNVHAKTGTHNNVSALSGYVRTRDGERLCFSMISNGAGVGGFKQLENAIAVQLAEFSYKDGTIAVPLYR